MSDTDDITALKTKIVELEEQLRLALARIAELEGTPPDAPPFVKANTKPRPAKTERKKRTLTAARKRQPPNVTEQHALDHCPDCAYRLSGQSISRRREVIDLSEPQPVVVTEHQIIKRWCPKCEKWREGALDLTGQVMGQDRFGVRLAALVAYLRTTLRLPVRLVQAFVAAQHGLEMSVGAIVRLCRQVADAGKTTVTTIKKEIQTSVAVHADETVWRENGQNGYVWSISSTTGCLYEFHRSRAQYVLKGLMGHHRSAVLISDFYCGYNEYAGPQQRCWVHLLRDLHRLKERHPTDASVQVWATVLRGLYDDGIAYCRGNEPNAAVRRVKKEEFEDKAHELGQQYGRDPTSPCCTLAKRVLRHERELFAFVQYPEVTADNNAAERRVRPVVVVRKISGGSRSAEGSKTQMILHSLSQTWLMRGLAPLAQFRALLQTPLPQL